MSALGSRSQRAPSPSNTTYSGISSYKSESYRTIGKPPVVPSIESRKIAKAHFDELQAFLAQHLAKEPPNSRTSAREKLTRLTKQQFQELSTDVYDELVRRNNNTIGNEVPFLPLRDDFHPKRNQARQKLATLPKTRFKDLASDVFFELGRRYPEFKEPEVPNTSTTSPGSNYDDISSTEYREPVSQPQPLQSSYLSGSLSRRQPSREQNSPFSAPPADRRRPSQEQNNDFYSASDRRRPSEDTLRSTDKAGSSGRRPSGEDSMSTSTTAPPAATATSGIVIPKKSTIAEEEIEVPYGRDDDVQGIPPSGNAASVNDNDRDHDPDDDRGTEDGASAGFKSPISPSTGLGGLSALSAIGTRRVERESDDDIVGGRSESDFYDKNFGRTSVASDKPTRSNSRGAGRPSNSGDNDRLRRDYELKIATMQGKIAGLESEAAEATAHKVESEDRVKALTDELRMLKSRAEDQSAALLALRRELDDAYAARDRERESRRRDHEDEMRRWKERCEKLENEREELLSVGQNAELMEQLRSDFGSVLTEVNDLSTRNEELMAARDADNNIIRDLNTQMKEYKRKYEQAKTELRSVKATSQLYHQAPKPSSDDQLPVAPSGGLLDIHVTAFLSSIDLLLTAGRSATPSRVYTPMKAVINAVHAIIDDVRKFEARPRRERFDVEVEDLQALCERADMTLSNLAAAARTHASSLGMSPVSLLDAAASHVSSAVTEIGKTIQIRKATRAEQESSMTPASPTNMSATNGFAPSLRSVDEGMIHMRTASSASSTRGEDHASPRVNGRLREMSPPPKPSSSGRTTTARRPPSDPSSSNASSPPAIFDAPLTNNAPVGPGSDESAATEGPDDAWAELKPYLETQSESIVYAIQSVLSAVRNPAPSPNLNENLTQIITIVSSIVAVCKDSLPSASLKEGNDILRELSDHCNKLSEIHAMPEVTKESRQAMAKSSFAIANAMKSLVKM